MNTNPLDSTAEEQASLWAARLDGSTLTAEDRTALDAWLAASSTHRNLLSQYCQFSADLEQTLPALAEAGLVSVPAPAQPHRLAWGFNWFAGGALAAIATAVVVWFAWPAANVQSFATPAAQRLTVTLSDGTRVDLNARTSLQVEMGRSERHVRLADGEAFFTVSKDKSRPFIVETPAGSVRVTGTVFDVRTETAAQLEVAVVEGSVQVRPDQNGGAPIALVANDHLVADAAGVVLSPLTADGLGNLLAWREGQIVFDRVPLRDALARFARYHGRGINTTAEVDAKHYNVGSFHSLDDLDGFLNSIEMTWPDLKVEREANGTVRVMVRPQP